ncbi:L-fucose-proton symporter-like [Nilaparvata lugens]|uniref:L-fucose-proton symporter-like n=1 Tax=Nilaparvata lugens TaxID=108931 RepID=UPI00193CABDC|nr:L-fucose-proton symporter-like [Nilaparvata lugens]
MWGLSYGLLDVLNKLFRRRCTLPRPVGAVAGGLFVGAYFLVALPAGYFMDRKGYKAGILVGLCLYALGALLFVPAASANSFGCSCLRCSLSPAVWAAWNGRQPVRHGAGRRAGRRTAAQLAQSFNGSGSLSAR